MKKYITYGEMKLIEGILARITEYIELIDGFIPQLEDVLNCENDDGEISDLVWAYNDDLKSYLKSHDIKVKK